MLQSEDDNPILNLKNVSTCFVFGMVMESWALKFKRWRCLIPELSQMFNNLLTV
jgi:hypothetical protein